MGKGTQLSNRGSSFLFLSVRCQWRLSVFQGVQRPLLTSASTRNSRCSHIYIWATDSLTTKVKGSGAHAGYRRRRFNSQHPPGGHLSVIPGSEALSDLHGHQKAQDAEMPCTQANHPYTQIGVSILKKPPQAH